MAKPKKPSQMAAQFEKEIKRLERLAKRAQKEFEIEFIKSPIPERPKRITKKAVEKIHAITYSDIQKKGIKAGEPFVPEKESRKRKPLTPLSEEEKKKIRSKAAKKAAKTRKKNQPPKPKKKKLTKDQLSKIRSEAAKKSVEARRRKAEQDPEYKKKLADIARKNLEKARAAKKKKKDFVKKVQDEAKKKQPKPPQEPKELDIYYPEDEDLEDLPEEGFIMLQNVKDELVKGLNKNIAQFINDTIDAIIDVNGLRVFLERIEKRMDILDHVILAIYPSEQDIVLTNGDIVLYIIYDGSVPESTRAMFAQMMMLDLGNRRRYRNYKK